MAGLDALHPLPGGKEWGPPASLPAAVAALKRLRERWLGVAGMGSERGLRQCAELGFWNRAWSWFSLSFCFLFGRHVRISSRPCMHAMLVPSSPFVSSPFVDRAIYLRCLSLVLARFGRVDEMLYIHT